MMDRKTISPDFFVAGGALPPDAPSYVERAADDELLKLALAGQLCYVLTPRQMGKSSLRSRTAARLKAHGVSSAIIDLTSIGSTTVTVDQWYLGLLTRLRRGLALTENPIAWWQAHAPLTRVQRFTNFLRHIVLGEITGKVVIFIDEIDATLKLHFTNEFLMAIRAMYNARADDSEFRRLAFVLLGVASPNELLKGDPRSSFNVGHRITLSEFKPSEISVLEEGLEALLPRQGQTILSRIYHWANGYPYLTQKLCLAVAKRSERRWSDEEIDRLVDTHYFYGQRR